MILIIYGYCIAQLLLHTSIVIMNNFQKETYDKLFKKPIDNMYDINRLKVIEKHLKKNNLI